MLKKFKSQKSFSVSGSVREFEDEDDDEDEEPSGPSWPSGPENSTDSITYRSNIQVTFHHRDLFMSTFKEYFTSMKVIEKSLSPEANRD